MTDVDKIQADWSSSQEAGGRRHKPNEAEIKRAALLAWEGHLTSVEEMHIENISIADIPCDQMKKLASIVMQQVWINNMTHADQLGRILVSVKCSKLGLNNMELSEAETRALVTAMRDRVEEVWLDFDVTLDIEMLTQYDGQGSCNKLLVLGHTSARYRDRLRRWVADKGWRVTMDVDGFLVMERE